PKARDFIHRCIWTMGTPERKELEVLFENPSRPLIRFAQMDKVQRQLDNLLKDRQVLAAQGVAVDQECKRVSADVQGALRTLQNNAAAKALQKKAAARAKGKSF